MRKILISTLAITVSALSYGADMVPTVVPRIGVHGTLRAGARRADMNRELASPHPSAARVDRKAAGRASFHAVTASESGGMEMSSFTVGYSSVLSPVMSIVSASGYSGTSVGDMFYYCDFNSNSSGGISSVNWNCVDVTGKSVKFTKSQTTANAVCMDMTYDETTGTLYGMSAMADVVVTVDPESGAAEYAFETLPFYTLAADAGGQLYGMLLEQDGGASLYTINKFTGAAMKVGSTGVKMLTQDGVSYFQTMAFSRVDGKLYWLTPSAVGTDLYRVDVTTGKANNLCTLSTLEALCMFDLPAELPEGSPEKVSEATAVADGMKVNISFKAPAKSVDGADLTDLTRIDIYRGGSMEAAYSVEDATPGDVITWSDTEAKAGINAYRIVAVNGVGESLPAYVTVFCGDDIPEAPVGVNADSDADGYPVITWEAPVKGMNGLDMAGVAMTYNVYRSTGGADVKVAEGLTELSYCDRSLDITRQDYPYYSVSAVSSAGEGVKSVRVGVHVGPAYTLPFEEAFLEGTSATAPWTMQSLNLGGAWELGIVSNAPGTGPYVGEGMLIFKGFVGVAPGAEARIVTPVLDLNVAGPELRFHFFHADFGEDMHFDDHMIVEVSVDGGEFKALPDADLYQYVSNSRWTEYVLPLDEYAGHDNVRIGFHGISAGGMDLVLDNIRVLDRLSGCELVEADDADGDLVRYNLQGQVVGADYRGVVIEVCGVSVRKTIR